MINVDGLPVPKLYNTISEHHIRTMCKVFGIALLVQFFLPWGIMGQWMVINFGTIWSFLMGAGLTALGFVKIPALRPGHLVAITGGAAFIGLISMLVGLAGGVIGAFPLLSFFGLFGVTVTIFGLFLWARQGHSTLAYWIVIGGLGSMALSLLIPIRGELPLIFMFKVFGAAGMNILMRIFFFLMSASYIGLGVLTLLFVVLKGDQAEDTWVRLMGVGLFLYIPLALMILGFFGMFTAGFFILLMFHATIMLVTYVFLTINAGIILLDASRAGRLKSFLGLS